MSQKTMIKQPLSFKATSKNKNDKVDKSNIESDDIRVIEARKALHSRRTLYNYYKHKIGYNQLEDKDTQERI
jgi:hypothetical protein